MEGKRLRHGRQEARGYAIFSPLFNTISFHNKRPDRKFFLEIHCELITSLFPFCFLRVRLIKRRSILKTEEVNISARDEKRKENKKYYL